MRNCGLCLVALLIAGVSTTALAQFPGEDIWERFCREWADKCQPNFDCTAPPAPLDNFGIEVRLARKNFHIQGSGLKKLEVENMNSGVDTKVAFYTQDGSRKSNILFDMDTEICFPFETCSNWYQCESCTGNDCYFFGANHCGNEYQVCPGGCHEPDDTNCSIAQFDFLEETCDCGCEFEEALDAIVPAGDTIIRDCGSATMCDVGDCPKCCNTACDAWCIGPVHTGASDPRLQFELVAVNFEPEPEPNACWLNAPAGLSYQIVDNCVIPGVCETPMAQENPIECHVLCANSYPACNGFCPLNDCAQVEITCECG